MTNNPRWMGLLVFIQTPVILAVVAIVAGEAVFLFALLGLMVGGASFLVGLWVAARHRQMKGREVVKSRITWSLLGSKIRLSFLVATPIIVLFGVLNINTLGAIE